MSGQCCCDGSSKRGLVALILIGTAVTAGMVLYRAIAPWFGVLRFIAWGLLAVIALGIVLLAVTVVRLEAHDRATAAHCGPRITVLAPGEWRSPRDGDAAGAVLIGGILFAPTAALAALALPFPAGPLAGLALIRAWSSWFRYGRRRDMEAAGVTELPQPDRSRTNRPPGRIERRRRRELDDGRD